VEGPWGESERCGIGIPSTGNCLPVKVEGPGIEFMAEIPTHVQGRGLRARYLLT
jgi:hypothetical protein